MVEGQLHLFPMENLRIPEYTTLFFNLVIKPTIWYDSTMEGMVGFLMYSLFTVP